LLFRFLLFRFPLLSCSAMYKKPALLGGFFSWLADSGLAPFRMVLYLKLLTNSGQLNSGSADRTCAAFSAVPLSAAQLLRHV
jgi:hypothetical protein